MERKEWAQQTKAERLETLVQYKERLEKRLSFIEEQLETMDMGRERNRMNDQKWSVKEKLEKLEPRIKWYQS